MKNQTKTKQIYFIYKEGIILIISKEGGFPGEIKETKELLAYEKGILASNIKAVHYSDRKQIEIKI